MKTYSPSRITTFEACPQKYKFRYLDKVKSVEETIEQFMGKRVHETLEKLYRDLILSKKNTLDELLDFYNEKWKKKWHKGVRVVKKEFSPNHYLETGSKCISDYYKRYFPFDQDRTLGLELRVNIPLNDDEYAMMGYIDRLAFVGEGSYEIHDYKTSSTFPDQIKIDQDRQLPLYQLAVEQMWRDIREVRLVWHYLAFDKVLRSKRSPEECAALKEEVVEIIKKIESATEFPPVESTLCNWCEYDAICPLWKHKHEIESLSPSKAKKEDGLTLANRYVSLTETKRGITEEIDLAREALIDYARENGLDVVFGDSHKIRIKSDRKLKFPAKHDYPETRAELEKVVQRGRDWADVYELNLKALEKAVREKKWKESQIKKIMEYAEYELKTSVYSSKIREEEE